MHFVDSDGDPPFDASIDFVVGPTAPASIPTLSEYTSRILGALLVLVAILAIRSTRRATRR